MELVFILTIVFCKISLINFFEVVEVIRAFRINALVENKVFSVFFRNQCVTAVRTA